MPFTITSATQEPPTGSAGTPTRITYDLIEEGVTYHVERTGRTIQIRAIPNETFLNRLMKEVTEMANYSENIDRHHSKPDKYYSRLYAPLISKTVLLPPVPTPAAESLNTELRQLNDKALILTQRLNQQNEVNADHSATNACLRDELVKVQKVITRTLKLLPPSNEVNAEHFDTKRQLREELISVQLVLAPVLKLLSPSSESTAFGQLKRRYTE